MILRQKEALMPASITLLCISQLLHRISGDSSWAAFSEGLLLGVATVFAVFALILGALAKSHE